MTEPRALSQDEFDACFAEPMRDVTREAEARVDIWSYVEALDLDVVGVPSVHDVEYVYRDANNRFDQVLIGTGRFNALLVIVVDLAKTEIVGHHLLDLGRIYGDRGGHLSIVP
jgi:hypothetical protein